jgi:Spy/CpxP family protein refolding chaperone
MGNRGSHFGGPGLGIGLGDLNLTDEQLEALRAARAAMHTAVQAAFEQFRDGSLTQEQLREAMDAARESFEAALQEILTPEQLAQLQQNRIDRLVQMIERRIEQHEQRAAHHLELLTQILGLNDEQVATIQEIQAGVVPALQTILAGVRDGNLTPEAAHDALRTLQDDTHAAIVAVLTPEQAELFADLRPHRRGPRGPGGPGCPGGRGA